MSGPGLHVGMDAGYFLQLRIAATIDFPTDAILVATIVVTKKAGTTVTPVVWDAAITEQTTEWLTVRHVFNADGTDLDVAGLWTAHVSGTTAVVGATKQTEPSQFTVLP